MLAKSHEVTVITDASRRVLIQPHLTSGTIPNLRVVYFRPNLLKRIPLNAWTAQILYSVWQYMLYPFAKKLHRTERFDLAIHVTYGVFRHPSFLGFLGVPFLYGPLGGGEDAPWMLKHGIRGREKTKEVIRALLNSAARINPALWIAFSKATLILVKTRETRDALPRPYRSRAVVHREIGVTVPHDAGPTGRRPGEGLHVLFVGRLLGWKGAHLAIKAIEMAIRQGTQCRLTIVGRGSYLGELVRLINALDAHKSVQVIDHMPQQELFSLYRTAHCFLFPSLHDSSGNVVLEAQAYGLPVVCLDLGGPPTLVTAESAFVIATRGKTESAVVGDLCNALGSLANDEQKRLSMAAAALANARRMTWESCVGEALALLSARSRTAACLPKN